MRHSLAALIFCAPAAFAQLAAVDPDWKEIEAPPPPALRTEGLIALDVPRAGLRYGIDPASVQVGRDGIVRYVVVATSDSGAVNAFYEGLRCNTAEARVYARHTPGAGWKAANADWKPLHDNGTPRHSLLVARSGACSGHAPNRSAEQIVRDLRAPVDRRFSTETTR